MSKALPTWAVEPIDMAGAAATLGVSRRTLVDALKDYPHYERRGSKKVFYPEHIKALREGLATWQDLRRKRAATGSSTPAAPLVADAFDRALERVTNAARKSSAPSSKRVSGSVIPMAKSRSAPSRRPL